MRRDTAAARKIAELLEKVLATPLGERLTLAAEIAGQRGTRVYLVGGAVRDLYLTGEIRDLDLLVASDGISFAGEMARRLDGRLEVHREFLTAEIVDRQGARIDLVSARTETYPEPAALPVVAPGRVEEDLARRDFTVNALAVSLDPEARFELLDPFNGGRDLEDRLLRVLHEDSFCDDPTRILRGVRLEHRLGLTLEPRTEGLAREAVDEGIFRRLSGARLRRELALLLGESGPVESRIDRLAALGLLKVLHPELELTDELRELLRRVDAERRRYERPGGPDFPIRAWRLHLLALAWSLSASERQELAERLQLAGDPQRRLVGSAERVREALGGLSRGAARPHEIDALLWRLDAEEIVLLTALGDRKVTERVEHWLGELRGFQLAITGGSLVARGVAPGPGIGRALQATREARLDGVIGAAEELEFALARLHREGLVAVDRSTSKDGR
ncbi:MAG: hypothetical protein V3T81_03060 [Thermoanaerobaculia bacterium]